MSNVNRPFSKSANEFLELCRCFALEACTQRGEHPPHPTPSRKQLAAAGEQASVGLCFDKSLISIPNWLRHPYLRPPPTCCLFPVRRNTRPTTPQTKQHEFFCLANNRRLYRAWFHRPAYAGEGGYPSGIFQDINNDSS